MLQNENPILFERIMGIHIFKESLDSKVKYSKRPGATASSQSGVVKIVLEES